MAKSVIFYQIPLKVDVTYNKKHKIPIFCVIGFQIHFEVTKVLRI
jgi:hypothetical protein